MHLGRFRVLLRIRCDARPSSNAVSLGDKFGCDPDSEAPQLVALALGLGLRLRGFSFHLGSPCAEAEAYHKGITTCRRLIKVAREAGCEGADVIDIGGGIPGERGFRLDEVSARTRGIFLETRLSHISYQWASSQPQ